jgi:di/tricarboxylate transporter
MSTINTFSLLPIANGGIKLGRTRTVLATLAIVISAITLATLQLVPLSMIFIVSVILLIGFNLVSLRGAYESIDWPVLVLLAGMITLGDALIASGTAEIISKSIVDMSHIFTPVTILIVILVTTMLISDYINTTAAAVIMAPIAILVASDIGVSVDPFLIAVAIGASSAFQSPVGHESNAFVMQKGGYQFSDFVKIGLPLEILIVIISVPVILIVWPL